MRHFSIFECVAHNEVCTEAFRMAGRDVVGIGRHTNAGYFAIDLRTACLCVLEFFKNEAGSTFTHNETIAAGAERTAGVFRVGVAG